MKTNNLTFVLRQKRFVAAVIVLLMTLFFVSVSGYAQVSPPPENPQSGAIGMEGSITAPPPDQAATIAVPSNGQSFTDVPITVSGLCPPGDDLIIKLFKNNIFSGSADCQDGSYSLEIDLFIGENILVARVFDALDQPGPDSNEVQIFFEDDSVAAVGRPTLTSNFAKIGANPGQTLRWPISITGGQAPYAFSVDWGDGTTPDLFTRDAAGTFDMEHIYERPGVYNIIVKATDNNGSPAFLQLVGVANGPLSQVDADGDDGLIPSTVGDTRILWQPAAILIPFIVSAFWLGKRHELRSIRNKIERGERPF